MEQFFQQYGILLLALVAIIFMFWSSRRRMQKMKAEQETKALQMVPGAKVLMQGGLYGTITEFDADDLSKPAKVELAPGVVVEVHSQGILRVVEPEEATAVAGDDVIADADPAADVAAPIADADDKPQV